MVPLHGRRRSWFLESCCEVSKWADHFASLQQHWYWYVLFYRVMGEERARKDKHVGNTLSLQVTSCASHHNSLPQTSGCSMLILWGSPCESHLYLRHVSDSVFFVLLLFSNEESIYEYLAVSCYIALSSYCLHWVKILVDRSCSCNRVRRKLSNRTLSPGSISTCRVTGIDEVARFKSIEITYAFKVKDAE